MLLDSVWGRGGAQVSLAFCHCVVSPLKPLLALRPVGHSACAWPQTSTLWFLCYRPQVNQGRATVCGPVIFSVGRGEAPWIWLSWPSRAAGLWTSPTSDLKCCFVLFLFLFGPCSFQWRPWWSLTTRPSTTMSWRSPWVRSSPTSGRRMEAGGRDRSMAGEVCSLTTL